MLEPRLDRDIEIPASIEMQNQLSEVVYELQHIECQSIIYMNSVHLIGSPDKNFVTLSRVISHPDHQRLALTYVFHVASRAAQPPPDVLDDRPKGIKHGAK